MQIDRQTVQGAGARLRQVGDDASAYLEKMSTPMSARIQGNTGLVSIATLKQVCDQLQRRTRDLASDSRSTGDRVMVAADSHHVTDASRAQSFAALSPSGSQ